MDFDVAYYEYYDCEVYDHISFISESGKDEECIYYLYIPKDAKTDEATPVIAYVTHGGGVAEEERANALHWAAGQDTEAIFVIPYTDRPEAVCASLEDARERLKGKGSFDAVSIHGTSSGGRAVIQAALKSTDPNEAYHFRIANICAYDPAQESIQAPFNQSVGAVARLAKTGAVLFIQTDTDRDGKHGGSGALCNRYARIYSEAGGIAFVAELGDGSSHESKFIKPLTHNSFNWAVGRGQLCEDSTYENRWYCYEDGIKYYSTLAEATELMQNSFNPDKPYEQAAA